MNSIITNPFNYKNYNFITENSVDIKDTWIKYAELNLNRAENQIKLNNILNDIDLAIKIELSIFEYALIYCQNNKFDQKFIIPVYQDKFHFIVSNINNIPGINNLTFKTEIINNNINPSFVAFLSPAQIHPKKWEHVIKKKEYIEQRENNIGFSDAYKCKKCGESKCRVTQAQTRSADEPMTTFVSCLVCHNTFKFC